MNGVETDADIVTALNGNDEVTNRFIKLVSSAIAEKYSDELARYLERASIEAKQKATEAEIAADTLAKTPHIKGSKEVAEPDDASTEASSEADVDSERKELIKAEKTAAEDMSCEIWRVDDVSIPIGPWHAQKDHPRLMYSIVQISNYYSRKFVPYDPLRLIATPEEGEIPDEHDKWVLVIRRVFKDNNTLSKTKLDIKSPLIIEVLQETIKEEKAELAIEKASLDWPHSLLFRYVSVSSYSYSTWFNL